MVSLLKLNAISAQSSPKSLGSAENPSDSALRQAQGGELVEPQTEPPPLRSLSLYTSLSSLIYASHIKWKAN